MDQTFKKQVSWSLSTSLPPSFPTHQHSPKFWEQLGRTVATFGCLEEVRA